MSYPVSFKKSENTTYTPTTQSQSARTDVLLNISAVSLSENPLFTNNAKLRRPLKPTFISKTILEFYQNNIASLYEEVVDGNKGKLGDLIDAIATATSLDLSASKDHQLLEAILKKAVEEATPIHQTHNVLGIRNKGGNDCFAISILQFIVHTPKLKELVLKQCPELTNFLNSYEKGRVIDSQLLRAALNLRFTEKKGLSSQEDIAEYLGVLLKDIGFQYDVEKFYDQSPDMDPIIRLNVHFDSLSEAITNYTLQQQMTFKKNPKNLVLQIDRKTSVLLEEIQKEAFIYKDTNLAKIPMVFTHDAAVYDLTCASLHEGSEKNGHYLSLIKKEGKWVLANDNKLSQLDEEMAQAYIQRQGCILHYEKIAEEKPVAPVKVMKPKQEPAVIAPVKVSKPEQEPAVIAPVKVSKPEQAPAIEKPAVIKEKKDIEIVPQTSYWEKAKWGLICLTPVVGTIALNILGII